MEEEIKKENLINEAVERFSKEYGIEENEIQEEREEAITRAHQIAPFWRKDIPHPLKDLCFDIYYIVQNEDRSRKWYPVNLPLDPKTGKIVPPFTEEEILEAGYGPGKYIFRPRSIKTGKVLPGAECHVLGISREYHEKEELMRLIETKRIPATQLYSSFPQPPVSQPETKPQTDMFAFMKEMIDNMNKQQQLMIELMTKQQEKMIEIMKSGSQATGGNLNTQVAAVVSALMGVLKEMEKQKAALETKKLDVDKELKLKEMELKGKLGSLKSKIEELPQNEKYQELKNLIEALEDRISEQEKKPSDWKNALNSFLSGFLEFLNMLTPVVSAVQKLQGQTNPSLEKTPKNTIKYKTNDISDKDLEEIERYIQEAEKKD